MILFNSTKRSNRLDYTLDYVFKQRLGIDYQYVDTFEPLSPLDFLMAYGVRSDKADCQMKAQGILFDEGTKNQYNNNDFLGLQDFNFIENTWEDALAAVFFHLSRYEEYQTEDYDVHGRFQADQSCLKTVGFKPIIDSWINGFKSHLIKTGKYQATDFKVEAFEHKATIDIDAAFAYKGRSLIRTTLAFGKDLLRFKWSELYQRAIVLLGLKPDPNDNFKQQFDTLSTLKANYFFLLGPYGNFDKNISSSNKRFQQLIKAVKAAGHTVGIHPSYASFLNPEAVLKQKQTLETIIGHEVIHSRQHFLKMQLPKSYQLLLEIGIQHDHSMGYSNTTGYRAATAQAFYWFDVSKNQSTHLYIHPFVVMDVAYKQHHQLNAEQSIQASKTWLENSKALQIPFTFVFHNESLSQHRGWQKFDHLFKFWCHGNH